MNKGKYAVFVRRDRFDSWTFAVAFVTKDEAVDYCNKEMTSGYPDWRAVKIVQILEEGFPPYGDVSWI